MDTQAVLDDLLAVLQTHGVTVRSEAMGGGATGLCTLKDKRVFFMDTDGPLLNTAIQAARAVVEVACMDTIYLRPQVRCFIEEYTGHRDSEHFD